MPNSEGGAKDGGERPWRESWREMGIDPADKARSVPGVEPSRERAQIRTECEGTADADADSGISRGGTMPP